MSNIFNVVNSHTGEAYSIEDVESPSGIITDTGSGFFQSQDGTIYAMDAYDRLFEVEDAISDRQTATVIPPEHTTVSYELRLTFGNGVVREFVKDYDVSRSVVSILSEFLVEGNRFIFESGNRTSMFYSDDIVSADIWPWVEPDDEDYC